MRPGVKGITTPVNFPHLDEVEYDEEMRWSILGPWHDYNILYHTQRAGGLAL